MVMPENLLNEYNNAVSKKTAILEKLKPLREKEEELRATLQPLQAELKAVLNEIASIEKENNLADISRTIATLAPRARRMEAKGGAIGVVGKDL